MPTSSWQSSMLVAGSELGVGSRAALFNDRHKHARTHTHTHANTYVYPCKCNKMQWDIGRARRRIVSVLAVHRPVYAYRVCSSSHAGHWHVPAIPCCWLCPIITFRRWIIIIESRDGWRGLHWFTPRASCSCFKPRCKRTSFHRLSLHRIFLTILIVGIFITVFL